MGALAEVRAKPKGRTFTAAFKRRVVEEAERMTPTERCPHASCRRAQRVGGGLRLLLRLAVRSRDSLSR